MFKNTLSLFTTSPSNKIIPSRQFKSRIFSGIQPTGIPHIGNYFGAIVNWVELQNNNTIHNLLYSVVDLHAITVYQDPLKLRESIYNTYISLLACGIDTKKSTLFVQSHVSGHAELAWLLNCNTTVGKLTHMTQFKDKTKLQKLKSEDPSINLGLLAYPVLMNSDILLYQSTCVPVGEDQFQHLELCRDTAQIFNNRYNKEIFPLPETLKGKVLKVMNLRDGNIKMSKSNISNMSRIDITDSKDEIANKIIKCKTDSENGISYNEKRAEICNLLRIFSAVTDKSIDELVKLYANSERKAFKQDLIDALCFKLEPISKKFNELQNDRAYVDLQMKEGSYKANEMAVKTLKEVREAMGFY